MLLTFKREAVIDRTARYTYKHHNGSRLKKEEEEEGSMTLTMGNPCQNTITFFNRRVKVVILCLMAT